MIRAALFFVALLGAVLASPAAHAQSAGAFARMGLGARSLAVGGQVADRTGQASPFFNPALAPFQPAQGVELSSGLLSFGRVWEAVQVGAPLRPRSGFAAGVVHSGVRDIDGRDADGRPTQTLQTDEYAFFATFGTRFSERVSGGIGMRIYRNALVEGAQAATALGVSTGLSAQLTPRVSAALVVDDLFARYEYNLSGAGGGAAVDRFPTRLTTGLAYSLGTTENGRPRGVVAADVVVGAERGQAVRPAGTVVIGGTVVPRDTTLDVRASTVEARLGGELWLADAFAVRGGVDRLGGDLGEARPALGFAVRRRFDELDLRVDYTAVLEPYATGIAHMATVRLGL